MSPWARFNLNSTYGKFGTQYTGDKMRSTKEERLTFWKFLVELKVDNLFLNNLKSNDSAKEYLQNSYKESFILDAFDLEASPEGSKFWHDIDWKWDAHLEALKDEKEAKVFKEKLESDFAKHREQFILFLEDLGVLKQFVLNLNVPLYEIDSPILFIRHAFLWSQTKEGFTFWNDINSFWEASFDV